MSAKNFVSIKLHSKLEFKRRTTADSKIFIKANSNINTQLGRGLVMSSPSTQWVMLMTSFISSEWDGPGPKLEHIERRNKNKWYPIFYKQQEQFNSNPSWVQVILPSVTYYISWRRVAEYNSHNPHLHKPENFTMK